MTTSTNGLGTCVRCDRPMIPREATNTVPPGHTFHYGSGHCLTCARALGAPVPGGNPPRLINPASRRLGRPTAAQNKATYQAWVRQRAARINARKEHPND